MKTMETLFGLKQEGLAIFRNSPGHGADEVCTKPVEPGSIPHTLQTRTYAFCPTPTTASLITTKNSCNNVFYC